VSAPTRTLSATFLAVVGLALVAGCVRVPVDGPVEETKSQAEVLPDEGVFIDPRPPQGGEAPGEIVDRFLDAMQATPIQTRTAREFLTADAAAAWHPEQIITYTEPPVPSETPTGVTVELTGASRLDERGAWQGALRPDERTLTFPMATVDGEWRIDAAPDALVVPEDWFESRYTQVNLYFFDPTASILVPEPVFVPREDRLASSMIKALVKGPSKDLRRVVQSFLPAGLEVAVGVTVSDDGLATIPLQGEAQLTAETIELMMAQFAWTLRQDQTIESIRVTVDGVPVPLPDGVSEYSVDGAGEYDPSGFQSSPLLFGLRGGQVVSGEVTSLAAVPGPLGTGELGLRSVGASLDAGTVAGVGAEGTALLVGTLDDPARERVRTIVSGGADLLRPAWDFADRIWLVDRTTAGARVLYVHGTRTDALRVPGLTGKRVRSFLVSRDGTRLVAVVRRGGQDVLVVSRIQHSSSGRVLGATRAERIGGVGGDVPIRDITWSLPDRVAVLTSLSPSIAEVARVSVDGSLVSPESMKTDVEQPLRALAGSPDAAEPLYGLARGRLIVVPAQQQIEVDRAVTTLVYVG
jgi:hypothetical protein